MQSFGPYTNLVEIGSGGMATVYRATAPSGNLVALKVIALHLSADPTARLRFEQESRLGLDHSAIVRVLDCGVEAGAPYLVMEYVVGESLDRRLAREGTLTPQQLAPILRDAARALDYAHAQGIIHRDVKPSNILIRNTGEALLGDFGVAKSAGQTAYTATTVRVGSVFYMSPEQANGAIEVTPATDIYSLGVTAYYALTGRHPFEADNDIAIARMHLDEKPPHICEVNPAVPKAVGAVVMQALEKDPRRRPASAGRFVRTFERGIKQANIDNRSHYRLKLAARVTLMCAVPLAALMTAWAMSDRGNTESATPTPTVPAVAPASSGTPTQNGAFAEVFTATWTSTSEPAPSETSSQTPTDRPSQTPEPTDTAMPSSTPVRVSTRAPTSTPAPTRRIVKPSPTPTRAPTRRPAPTKTRTPTSTPAPTGTPVLITAEPSPTAPEVSTAVPVTGTLPPALPVTDAPSASPGVIRTP